MFELQKTDKLTELLQKIADEHAFKIKSIEDEITQLTGLLIQDGALLKSIEPNYLEQKNLIDCCNSKLS